MESGSNELPALQVSPYYLDVPLQKAIRCSLKVSEELSIGENHRPRFCRTQLKIAASKNRPWESCVKKRLVRMLVTLNLRDDFPIL